MTIKTWQERMMDRMIMEPTDKQAGQSMQAEIDALRAALEAALQDLAAMATELARVRAKWTEESLIMEEVCRANTLLEKRLAAWEKQEPYGFVDARHDLNNFDGTIYKRGGFDSAIPLYTKPKEAT
jgi:hypothetical protein